MGRIKQGENIFESMRLILPKHREMMQKQKDESTRTSRTKTASTAEGWQHKHLNEDDLNEAGRLLGEAGQDGFAVTVTFATKVGVRTTTGYVTELRGSTHEIVLDVRGEVLRVSVANLMKVETAGRE